MIISKNGSIPYDSGSGVKKMDKEELCEKNMRLISFSAGCLGKSFWRHDRLGDVCDARYDICAD